MSTIEVIGVLLINSNNIKKSVHRCYSRFSMHSFIFHRQTIVEILFVYDGKPSFEFSI